MTTSSANNSVFMSFFEKQKLTRPKFIDWYRQLRIVLSIKDKLNYLEQPILPAPVAPAGQHVAPEILAAHNALIKGSKEIQAEQELLQTTRDFHSCKQEREKSVSSYGLKMKGYIDNLEHLGHPITLGLGVSLILIDLRKEYDSFVQNYNMHIMGKRVNKLHAMLKLHEQTLPKNNALALHAIRAGKVQKVNKHKKSQTQMAARGQNHGKGKNKQAYAPKPKIPPLPKREDPTKDSIFHECENNLINQEASGSLEDLEIIQEEDTHPFIDTSLDHEEDDLEIDEPPSDIVPIRRSTRTRHVPDRMYLYIDAEEHGLGDLGEPANYKAVLLDPDKWLFKKKTNMDGVVHTYKARLVAKGYTQTPKIDYEETFSPVSEIRAIRILIAIVVYYDYEIWQMDVKTAFLNGYLNEKVYMEQPKGASTPAELKRMQNVPYASAVGSIMYDVRCTRLDVAIAQNVTSRFQQNPGDLHWTTVKNILKYLKNTKDMFLVYEGDLKREFRVSCYTNAGYLTGADDLKSYIAAFDASKEAVWVRKFIFGLCVVPTIKEPISMYCDNMGAIAIANESGITKGARHFRAKGHYLRKVIEYGDIKLEKVHTDDNLADPFTKALAFLKHSEHTRNIRMLPASSLM
nr:hypothetical protein [Tanacetum cinerariifolium]